ncbi:MAG: GNAT family N-acetyltransferase [Pseudobdellovibrionaceae bacterium]
MKIHKISDPELRSQVCDTVLRSLPLWFGIESAIVDYVNDVKPMQTWVAYDFDTPVGFVSIQQHFPPSAEIHVMGILEKFHRKGIGHQLVQTVESELRQQGTQFLTVKTLSESRPNKEYDQTRKFYLKAGFVPLEELKTLWGEANPCLLLVKAL